MSDSETNVLVPEQRRCTIRVLIVADGRIHFKEPSPIAGFNLNELIEKALRQTTRPWEDLHVTTARRSIDNKPNDTDGCADIPDFVFNQNMFGIDNYKYDQVWLFGDNGEDGQLLTESELEVLSRFMNAGGGVFATGDHADLGYALCSKVPRVRSMRKWCFNKCGPDEPKAPSGVVTRIDTLREGSDPGFQLSDQSDATPQDIQPKFFLESSGHAAFPHPLLVDGKFVIAVLPDHFHEGECVIPANLNKRLKFGEYVFDEYPPFSGTLLPTSPHVVALATSAGGLVADDDSPKSTLPPVEPRSYYPIVAYDGHYAVFEGKPIGRVVVDSSFHHFLDRNLRGTGSGASSKRGFYDARDNPTDDYLAFKEYFRNIARFLCPPSLRLSYYRTLLVDLLSSPPLAAALGPLRKPACQDHLAVGAIVEQALNEKYSATETLQCVLALMSSLPDELRRPLASLIDPWLPSGLAYTLRPPKAEPDDASKVFVDFKVLVRLFLGIAVCRIGAQPPAQQASAGAGNGNELKEEPGLNGKLNVNVIAQVLSNQMK